MNVPAAGDGVGGAPSRGAAGDGLGAPGAARGSREALADDGLTRGRLTYADRVLSKVAEQAAAQAIGIPRRDVTVDVTQFKDAVALRVSTPLPVPSLDDPDAIRAGKPVLERVSELQDSVSDHVSRLLGRDVSRIDITVTGAVIARKRRVK